MQLVKSEEEAKKGLAAFDPKGTMDWSSRKSPQSLYRSLTYGMFKKDSSHVEKCFDWEKFILSLAKAQGQTIPPEMVQQQVEMVKPFIMQNIMSGGGNMKGYYLLLVEQLVNVKMDGETKAIIQMTGQPQKFLVEKGDDGWKISGIKLG